MGVAYAGPLGLTGARARARARTGRCRVTIIKPRRRNTATSSCAWPRTPSCLPGRSP